ncbi:MAG TPA: DUF4328 domain-containing protein [Pyrinomonadaceae bacterium]|nr:DUF4328 domain-containing protein [Pyrinomonadaceae bacterium]
MEYRSTATYSLLATIGVGAVGLLHVPAVIVGLLQIADPSRTLGSGSDSMSLWLVIQSLFAIFQFLAFIGAAIVFLMWLHRSAANLAPLGASYIEFTPGWCVGWWFIPFANLVKPFQAVRSVWAESDPAVDPADGTFLASVQTGAPAFMSLWWAAWILANVVSNITSKVFDPQDVRTTELSGYFFIIDGLLWVIAAVFAIKVVRSITSRQEERHANYGRIVSGPPPPPTFHGDQT